MRQHARLWPNKIEAAIPLIDILRHPWFFEGFHEASRGLPAHWKNNKGIEQRDKWFYERGRRVGVEALSSFGRCSKLWIRTGSSSVINPQIISLAGAMFLTGAFA
jgi:hypothetical protein